MTVYGVWNGVGLLVPKCDEVVTLDSIMTSRWATFLKWSLQQNPYGDFPSETSADKETQIMSTDRYLAHCLLFIRSLVADNQAKGDQGARDSTIRTHINVICRWAKIAKEKLGATGLAPGAQAILDFVNSVNAQRRRAGPTEYPFPAALEQFPVAPVEGAPRRKDRLVPDGDHGSTGLIFPVDNPFRFEDMPASIPWYIKICCMPIPLLIKGMILMWAPRLSELRFLSFDTTQPNHVDFKRRAIVINRSKMRRVRSTSRLIPLTPAWLETFRTFQKQPFLMERIPPNTVPAFEKHLRTAVIKKYGFKVGSLIVINNSTLRYNSANDVLEQAKRAMLEPADWITLGKRLQDLQDHTLCTVMREYSKRIPREEGLQWETIVSASFRKAEGDPANQFCGQLLTALGVEHEEAIVPAADIPATVTYGRDPPLCEWPLINSDDFVSWLSKHMEQEREANAAAAAAIVAAIAPVAAMEVTAAPSPPGAPRKAPGRPTPAGTLEARALTFDEDGEENDKVDDEEAPRPYSPGTLSWDEEQEVWMEQQPDSEPAIDLRCHETKLLAPPRPVSPEPPPLSELLEPPEERAKKPIACTKFGCPARFNTPAMRNQHLVDFHGYVMMARLLTSEEAVAEASRMGGQSFLPPPAAPLNTECDKFRTCSYCDKWFSSPDACRLHVKEAHGSKKPQFPHKKVSLEVSDSDLVGVSIPRGYRAIRPPNVVVLTEADLQELEDSPDAAIGTLKAVVDQQYRASKPEKRKADDEEEDVCKEKRAAILADLDYKARQLGVERDKARRLGTKRV